MNVGCEKGGVAGHNLRAPVSHPGLDSQAWRSFEERVVVTVRSEFRVEIVRTSVGEDGRPTAVVQVWGELDIETSPMLVDVIHSAGTPGVQVVVDLSTVDFIDSVWRKCTAHSRKTIKIK